MPDKDPIAPGVWLAGAFTFAAFALSKSAFSEWFEPVSVYLIFWLCIGFAVVCAFMALRTYFIAVGRREAGNLSAPQHGSFLTAGPGVTISNSQISDNVHQVGALYLFTRLDRAMKS